MADQPQKRNCGTMIVHNRLLRTNPEYVRAREQSENIWFDYRVGRRAVERTGVTVIPVVVHVVWNKDHPEQNISDDQVKSQISVLNQDFRKTNPDVSTTPPPFLPLCTDARVEFVLADKDPGGNPTNGITRTKTNTVGFTDDNGVKSAGSGGADPWPSDKYLNLWVCPLGNSLLGYAQFPGGPTATDGVVILHSAFGNTGTAAPPFDKGRTATHEIGHWLNLRHIWGDDGTGCSGSDFVDDTPNQAGPNFGAPSFPHVTCSNGPNGDMFMNYMDYVDDRAMVMFSKGQADRMQASLDHERASIGTTKPVMTSPAADVATLKFNDDPGTLKFGDDPITVKFKDDPITLKFKDDPPTLKFKDDPPTLKFQDDPNTLKFKDDPPTCKFQDDPITLKFKDDPSTRKFIDDVATLKFADDPATLKFGDDPVTLKNADDIQTSPLADAFKHPPTDGPGKPISSDLNLPGGGTVEFPGPQGRGTPFTLATGHHSSAWTGSYPEAAARSMAEIEQLLPQYEQALQEINKAVQQGNLTQQDLEYAERIESEYTQLHAEYIQMTGGR